MFAAIAPTYDRLNRIVSLRQDQKWRAEAVRLLALKPGNSALDLCTGTGDFLAHLRRAIGNQGRLIGLDFCLPMLELAPEKEPQSGLALGDACCLPFADNSFDAVTVGWGIRNVPDIDLAHREIVRVLKPGGRFISVDMAVPRQAIVRAASQLFTLKGIPMIGSWLSRDKEAYRYLPESTQRFWSREKLAESMRASGMVDVRWIDRNLGNICYHLGTKP